MTPDVTENHAYETNAGHRTFNTRALPAGLSVYYNDGVITVSRSAAGRDDRVPSSIGRNRADGEPVRK